MPNAIEELNKLIQRLEMLFQVQTHEVVQDLKKIKEMLVDTEPQNKISNEKQPKLEKVSETTEAVVELKKVSAECKTVAENANKRIEQWIQQPIEEIKEDKTELVKRYIEKFNKKPFAWWSVEVIKEKLGE